jgi:hypothetical protein
MNDGDVVITEMDLGFIDLVRLERATGHKDTEECKIRSIYLCIYVMDDEDDELKPRSKCCLCEIVSSIYS